MTLKERILQAGFESVNLDDIVHDAASSLATNANNGGLDDQIEFLVTTCGWTEEQIMEALQNQ